MNTYYSPFPYESTGPHSSSHRNMACSQVYKTPVPHLRLVFQQSWVMWMLSVYNLIFHLVPIILQDPVRNTARNTLNLDRLGSQSLEKIVGSHKYKTRWVPSTSTSRIAKSSQKTSPFLFHSHSEPAAHSAFHLRRRGWEEGNTVVGRQTWAAATSLQFPCASPVLSVRLHYCI